MYKGRRTPKKRTAMQSALSVLAHRRTSERQMEKILVRKGCSHGESRDCIDRLIEWGYLDDKEYARDIAKDMTKGVPYGKIRVVYELKKRLIPEDLADEVVQEVYSGLDEEDMVVRAGMKYMNGSETISKKRIHSLSRWLIRRGFESETVGKLVGRLIRQESLE